jgi:hypothetical protein
MVRASSKKGHKKKIKVCATIVKMVKRKKEDETLQTALPLLPDSGSSVALVPST